VIGSQNADRINRIRNQKDYIIIGKKGKDGSKVKVNGQCGTDSRNAVIRDHFQGENQAFLR